MVVSLTLTFPSDEHPAPAAGVPPVRRKGTKILMCSKSHLLYNLINAGDYYYYMSLLRDELYLLLKSRCYWFPYFFLGPYLLYIQQKKDTVSLYNSHSSKNNTQQVPPPLFNISFINMWYRKYYRLFIGQVVEVFWTIIVSLNSKTKHNDYAGLF